MSDSKVIGKPALGPWSFEMVRHAPIKKEFGCYLLLDSQKNNVALISSWMDSPSTAEEAEANANLIGAAPDLLAALERCELLLRTKRHACEDSNLCRVLDGHISQARSAINKARGLSQ
jgi:hypothetical protein